MGKKIMTLRYGKLSTSVLSDEGVGISR